MQVFFSQLNLFLQFMVFSWLFKYDALYKAFGFEAQPVIIGFIIILQYIFAPFNMVRNFDFPALQGLLGLPSVTPISHPEMISSSLQIDLSEFHDVGSDISSFYIPGHEFHDDLS